MNAKAFCPGHITGFFQICEGKDFLSTGSRGAGLCLSLGATSTVTVAGAKRQSIEVIIDGQKSLAEVTKHALRRILGPEKLHVSVVTLLDLPQSQGFGMSAAGALSSSLALCKLLGRSRQQAFEAAHIAEIETKCGLGDVAAIHRGGITVRTRPGLPPVGEVMRIEGNPEMVLSVVGRRLLTRTVLSDPAKRKAINDNGALRVDDISRNPSFDRLMDLSQSFAFEAGLASKPVTEAVNAASKLGKASMAMLGNSVFATGDSRGLQQVLSEFGETWKCKVDSKGPRIL